MKLFMDEFSVYGSSFKHCLKNLEIVLQKCQDKNLALKNYCPLFLSMTLAFHESRHESDLSLFYSYFLSHIQYLITYIYSYRGFFF